MSSANGLVCFQNGLLALEDGTLIERDLWIDERTGRVVDAQNTSFNGSENPSKILDLQGDILSPGFIDIQMNGAYGVDFSEYDSNDDAYREGAQAITAKIVETGVTSLVATVITREKSLYPRLLSLLTPRSSHACATLLGWHAEGPFLAASKHGVHPSSLLLSAPEGVKTFEDVYGEENLADAEDWCARKGRGWGVRLITLAPDVDGVMDAIKELSTRGLVISIGHSMASTAVATSAVRSGARLITHLFNAMPQLHHRDPSIIGLLGASPHLPSPFASHYSTSRVGHIRSESRLARSEAFDEVMAPTPPWTPIHLPGLADGASGARTPVHAGNVVEDESTCERPFYSIIVDGIHLHPNSVRLAYAAHPDGCILITDAMKILDPRLKDGPHEWRRGQRIVKDGDKLFLEGTNTLAGSLVTLDKCVRNLHRFTGCSLSEAIRCATYNPAKCLGIEDRKGTLRLGADADLVVLDWEGNVKATWVGGKEVWNRKGQV